MLTRAGSRDCPPRRRRAGESHPLPRRSTAATRRSWIPRATGLASRHACPADQHNARGGAPATAIRLRIDSFIKRRNEVKIKVKDGDCGSGRIHADGERGGARQGKVGGFGSSPPPRRETLLLGHVGYDGRFCLYLPRWVRAGPSASEPTADDRKTQADFVFELINNLFDHALGSKVSYPYPSFRRRAPSPPSALGSGELPARCPWELQENRDRRPKGCVRNFFSDE